jgi:S1-C subfamily serine protease
MASSSKRKQPPSPNDRPAKQMRPGEDILPSHHSPHAANGFANGSSTSSIEEGPSATAFDDASNNNMDIEESISLSRVPTAQTAEAPEWQATIERVVKNVVAIHFSQTCSFDTESALTSEATGFVVDAERGYILTNRHVVGPGPFWGHCIFDNHEEVSCFFF